MVGMKSEVNWEKVKSNEVTFTDVITDFLIKSGSVCMVAANGTETLTKVNNRDAPFIVIITATDIHLPCLENLCVGTSWLIFRRTEESRDVLLDREVYRSGRKPITAGVLVNGCVTTITVGFKWVGGIHHFIFDTRYGDFILLHDECYLRQSGNILSLNEGLFYKFKKCVQDWLMEKKRSEEGYLSRYTGGWLTDGYRILRSGGLLLSPKDSECNRGRVKILFKALPLAYLAEKAGAKATNGRVLITKAPRSANNIFTSLVLGSIANVDSFMEINKDASVSTRFFYAGDSEETSTDLE